MNGIAAIDAGVALVEGHYRLFQESLVGLFARFGGHSFDAYAKVRRQLDDSSALILRQLQDTLTVTVDAAVERVFQAAIADLQTMAWDELREGAHHTGSIIVPTVMNAAQRDVLALQGAIRSESLHAAMRRGAAPATGALRAMAHLRVVGKPSFDQYDRLGRRLATANHVRLSTRHALLLTHVETTLYAISLAGEDIAEIRNPGKANHGDGFSISGMTSGLPSYEEIKEGAFHPNSTALVTRPASFEARA